MREFIRVEVCIWSEEYLRWMRDAEGWGRQGGRMVKERRR